MSIDGTLSLGSWLGLIHFETLVFVIGTAIFTVAMARERAELRYMAAASIDPLTGVSNRRAFMETAEELVRAHASDKRPLSLILFDLDRFKSVNDSFGHAAGDTVLKRFADVTRSSLRASDLVGRPGGEEFAVLLPGSNKAAALVVAERIRIAVAEACRTVDDRAISATVSAGVTTALPTSTLDSLMAAADEALYRAKAEGRNRVEACDRTGPPDLASPTVASQERRVGKGAPTLPDPTLRSPPRAARWRPLNPSRPARSNAEPAAFSVEQDRRRQAESESALFELGDRLLVGSE